ncbi:hypothetical protein MCAMS1_00775 [biofilm metagenome]
MTPDTNCPELERQFIAAGCDGMVAVHAASRTKTFKGQDSSCLKIHGSTDSARREEFTAGRMLAQQCLLSLGQQPTPIGRGVDREPLWPKQTVGSITHTDTFAAAVVWMPDIKLWPVCIGIDAEHFGRLSNDDWPTVFTDQEIKALNQKKLSDRDQLATYMFSAKEAVYKTQFPLTRRFIEFNEVSVSIQFPGRENCHQGRLLIEHDIKELAPFHFSVFYYCLESIVITGAVALPKSICLQNGN